MFNLNFNVMKMVKFFSIALVSSFLVASSVFATDGDKSNLDVKAAENSVREQLASVLSSVSVEEAGEVFVYFSISPKGEFELNGVKGENEGLTNQVKETLHIKAISSSTVLNGKFAIKVRFVSK
jgi:hypothetical protein